MSLYHLLIVLELFTDGLADSDCYFICREKGRDLTKSYDTSTYANRTIAHNKAKSYRSQSSIT